MWVSKPCEYLGKEHSEGGGSECKAVAVGTSLECSCDDVEVSVAGTEGVSCLVGEAEMGANQVGPCRS